MASEDVIELGSSDEESEPAPKKAKPMPNAMVHIPRKLPGVTIKPTSSNANLLPKGAIKNKSIQNAVKNYNVNPLLMQNKINGKPISKNPVTVSTNVTRPLPIQRNISINPLNAINKLVKPSPVVNKTLPPTVLKKPLKIQNSKLLCNLPSSITVKRSATAVKKPIQIPVILSTVQKIPCIQSRPNKSLDIKKIAAKKLKPNTGQNDEVMTVELDDEESDMPTNVSPQWYLNPEAEINKEFPDKQDQMEEENNREPNKFIEITIEDSPVKPQAKRTCEVGTELAITIEDSPVKAVKEKPAENSDDEQLKLNDEKEFQSKKKLEYLKKEEGNVNPTIEIELDIVEPGSQVDDKNEEIEPEIVKQPDPISKTSELQTTKDVGKKSEDVKNVSEFHPVYQEFIDLCFKLENSDDMRKIVEKKIKTYYKQCPKEYVESEEFIEMVSSKICAMKVGPEKMYLFIKDVVDELNLQRKREKPKETKNTEAGNFLYGEESEFGRKRQRQIRKLEKTLKKLHRAIQKLEEQEVDFEDEDDSVYLLTERYKERMVRVHAKFCQLTNTKMPSEPRIMLETRPGQPTGPAKRLEKWINKKVPIGTPLPFPDFHDVLKCVREANQEDKLGWNEAIIMEEARDLFTRCGKKLQRRRQENEWRLTASRVTNTDPVEDSEDLKQKLDANKTIATKKETEVFNMFADRQNQLKLEAEEIGDKEAEESPVESEDDEVNDEETNSMQDKQKRKERLKRLLQEKNKKTTDEQDLVKKEPEKTSDNVVENNEKENVQNLSEKNEVQTEEPIITEDKDNKTDKNENNGTNDSEKILCLSDDSNEINSDIDELHLLQKLHSENEINTSTQESDSESAVAISDSFESDDGENIKKVASDVISIENSSYSESETNKDELISYNAETAPKSNIEDLLSTQIEIEYATDGNQIRKNDEVEANEESMENMLLASPGQDSGASSASARDTNDEEYINLKDDSISITDTVIYDTTMENTEAQDLVTEEIAEDTIIEDLDSGSPNSVIEMDAETDMPSNKTEGHDLPESADTEDNMEIENIDSQSPNSLIEMKGETEIVANTTEEQDLPESVDVEDNMGIEDIDSQSPNSLIEMEGETEIVTNTTEAQDHPESGNTINNTKSDDCDSGSADFFMEIEPETDTLSNKTEVKDIKDNSSIGDFDSGSANSIIEMDADTETLPDKIEAKDLDDDDIKDNTRIEDYDSGSVNSIIETEAETVVESDKTAVQDVSGSENTTNNTGIEDIDS